MSRPAAAWPAGSLAVAWGATLGSTAASPWLVGAPAAVLLLPWTASLVVLGLPHGALDVFVPARMRGRPLRAGRILRFCAAYLAAAAAVIGAWALAPSAAAVAFVALTWGHWGQGDVFALRAYGKDRHLASRAQLLAAATVRGGLPMLVPLAAHPEDYAAVLDAAASVFGRTDGAGSLALAAAPWLPISLVCVAAAYAGWGAVVAARRGGKAWSSLAFDLGEVALLASLFTAAPPLWSVGVYFCAWHSLRHLARVEPIVAPGRPVRLALFAAPATVGALAVVAAVAAASWSRGVEPDALAVYLVAIAALTVPHVAVVGWMDWRQRVWEPGGAS